jgi:hypothetical protein
LLIQTPKQRFTKMKLLVSVFITFSINLLFNVSNAANTYPSRNQNVTIQRLTSLVSSFPAFSQYQAVGFFNVF